MGSSFGEVANLTVDISEKNL